MWKEGSEVWIKYGDDIFVARLVSRFPSDFSVGGLWKFVPYRDDIYYNVVGVWHIVAKFNPLEPPMFVKRVVL